MEKEKADYNDWLDKKQKEIFEEKRKLEKESYDAIKNMRTTCGRLRKIDEDYNWEIRKRLTSENWSYMLEEIKKLFYIALAKANISLSDISITEYEDDELHRVNHWERIDEKIQKVSMLQLQNIINIFCVTSNGVYLQTTNMNYIQKELILSQIHRECGIQNLQ